MKKILIVTGVLAVVALLVIPKINEFTGSKGASKNGKPSNAPLSVEVFVIRPDTIQNNIFTTGTLIANENVELASERSGLIQQIYLEEGKTVKKNELLVKINDSELQAQLKRAQFRLTLAKDRELRQKQLLDKGGISQEEYDATLNEVNVLQAEVRLIEAQIDKTEIRAPFDGQIGLKYVSEGSYINPSTRIATLQDIDPIKIDFSVPERYAPQIEVGNKISFTVSGSGQTFYAEVYAKEPRIDTETRSLQVRAKSDNKEGRLLPGAFADLELTLSTVEDALMVPSISLVPELQGQKVFVIKNGLVQPQSVETGLRTAKKVQIIKGIAAGDSVLTTGLLQVRPGMPVKISHVEAE